MRTESEYLELFYSDDILGRYCEQTNLKVSKQATPAWSPEENLTIPELKRYYGVDMYMDLVQRAGHVRGYWSKGRWGDPHVRRAFSRTRFEAIRNNLTWTDTSDLTMQERAQKNIADGFWTINGLVEALKDKFQYYYKPLRHVAIDEMCVFFKGRHRCRCYNPNKPNKWHFKIYCLADSSNGYLYNWFLYRGKDERRPAGVSASEYPVMKLTEPETLHSPLGTPKMMCYVCYTDNWFTSMLVARRLRMERRILLHGTIRPGRIGVPAAAKFPKAGAGKKARGDMQCLKATADGEDYYLTSWQDNKPVHMLSWFPPKKVNVKRSTRGARGGWQPLLIKSPTTIGQYNPHMNGVDRIDSKASTYDARFRLQTRWQPRIERRCLRVAALNGNTLKNAEFGEQQTSLEYLKRVIEQWTAEDEDIERWQTDDDDDSEDDSDVDLSRRHASTWEKDLERRLTGQHFPEILESKKELIEVNGVLEEQYNNIRGRCKVCGRSVPSVCENCDIFLCIKKGNRRNCFKEFHSEKYFGAQKRKAPPKSGVLQTPSQGGGKLRR